MTKDQQKFWDILRLPYEKTCLNCKYHGDYDCPDTDEICSIMNNLRKWVWKHD